MYSISTLMHVRSCDTPTRTDKSRKDNSPSRLDDVTSFSDPFKFSVQIEHGKRG